MNKLFVIIVNYCQPQLTIKCIESIRKSKGVDPFIVVVDNASSDNSYEILNETAENIALIRSDENNGFAAGNNIGIRYAIQNGADSLMLLNNDTEIDPDMISNLLKYADEKTAVSPKMYYYDRPDTIWYAGGDYQNLSGRFVHLGENQKDSNEYDRVTECDFLTGCCILFTKEVYDQIGEMNESYFMYLEDVEYSLRMKEKGIRMLMIPEAKLWHKVGSSSGGEKSKTAVYYGNRNRLFLLKQFNFPFIIRVNTLLSRILLMLKGYLFNTNEKYIRNSLSDYYSGVAGKKKDL